jgi:hypothetical protein
MDIFEKTKSSKEINGFKKFNGALKQMGRDVTPPPFRVEKTNVLWSHLVLSGEIIHKTRGFPESSHTSPHFTLMSLRSFTCETTDPCGKLQVQLQIIIPFGLTFIMIYTSSASLTLAITLKLPYISSSFFIEPPFIKWELTPTSLMNLSKGGEGETNGIWIYL